MKYLDTKSDPAINNGYPYAMIAFGKHDLLSIQMIRWLLRKIAMNGFDEQKLEEMVAQETIEGSISRSFVYERLFSLFENNCALLDDDGTMRDIERAVRLYLGEKIEVCTECKAFVSEEQITREEDRNICHSCQKLFEEGGEKVLQLLDQYSEEAPITKLKDKNTLSGDIEIDLDLEEPKI